MLLLDSSPEYYLNSQAIDLYVFFLDQADKSAQKFLSEEEQRIANRFLFPRHQRRYTIAHAILRILISRYLKQDPLTIYFKKEKHGKPYIENSNQLRFNLTHSGELAILAIGKSFELGVDAEFFSSRSYEGIAENLYSSEEINDFLALPPILKPLAFFNIWAQKEAFIKANGMGLSYPTKNFTVPVLPSLDECVIFDPLQQCHWKMISFMPRIACSAALCYHPSIKKINYHLINSLATLREESKKEN